VFHELFDVKYPWAAAREKSVIPPFDWDLPPCNDFFYWQGANKILFTMEGTANILA
jgi:hypothetical protein